MELPNGWQSLIFGDFCTLKRGYDLPLMERRPGPFPIFAANGVVGLHDEAKVKGPGLVTGRSGTIGKVAYVKGDFWPLNTALYAQELHENDPSFAYHFIDWFDLGRFATGTGVPTLNRNIVHEQFVNIPPLGEQKKIAEVLGSVDEAIQATQAVIDQTRKVKQGLLQQLLTRGIGHTRFKQTEIGEIPESWEVAALVDLVPPKRPIAYGVLKPGPFVDGGTPMLRIMDIRGGRVSTMGIHLISRALDEEFRRTRLEGGETVISLVGTIGLTARVPEVLASANLHRNLGRIAPGPRLNSHFLASVMESNLLQDQIARATKGGNQPLLNLGDVKQFLIPVPPRAEQALLVERLQSVSNSLGANEDEYTQLTRAKTGLMSDLLSGRVRVQVSA